ncbi:MAG: hypothetical protein OXC61_05520 [Flavobacteriaceae bacterium]|nr:hypothetical protein [Flavobacteriaceae bacterium]
MIGIQLYHQGGSTGGKRGGHTPHPPGQKPDEKQDPKKRYYQKKSLDEVDVNGIMRFLIWFILKNI